MLKAKLSGDLIWSSQARVKQASWKICILNSNISILYIQIRPFAFKNFRDNLELFHPPVLRINSYLFPTRPEETMLTQRLKRFEKIRLHA